MGILSWEEIWQGREGELEMVGAVRTYQRVFRVLLDTVLPGPSALLASSEFVGLLVGYVDAFGQTDVGSILRNVRVEQPEEDNPFIWVVTYNYSSEPLDPQQRGAGSGGEGDPNAPAGEGIQNPIARPPIWSLEPEKFQRVMAADIFGNPVCNSAGALFSPLPEVDDTRWMLVCERNELEPDFPLILQYQDAINLDVFAGFLPGTCKIRISAHQMYENNLYYWKMRYAFETRSYVYIYGVFYSGWDVHLVDRGFYYLDKNLIPRKILDAQGVPVSDPVLLDGQGGQLGTANNPTGAKRSGGAKSGVTGVIVNQGGAGYSNIPSAGLAVTLTGGGGTGATAVAVAGNTSLNPNAGQNAGGPISAILVTNPGSGYTSAPTVTILGGGGAGATATATIGYSPVWLHFRPHNWLPFALFDLPVGIT